MSAVWQRGIAGLAADYRAGRTDPVIALEVFLDRIARLDPGLNTIVTLDADGARAAARGSAARLKSGAPRSVLDGIPLTIKDNLLVGGVRATWGSRAYADHVPDEDEQPVARLRAAGAVLVGKTNVPELTLEGYTSNLLFGATGNPWNPALTPGGSSGGAAAGVAAGLVPAAVGTDGGGSIRRPAGHTGLVGFKPSIGRVPRGGGFPQLLHDFEVIGTLTRTVEDAVLLDEVLSGKTTQAGAERPLRILYMPHMGDAPLDPEIADRCDAVARALSEAGHDVQTAPVFFDRGLVDEIWRVVGRAGVAHLANSLGGRLHRQGGPSVNAMVRDGMALSAADYVEALARLDAFRSEIAAVFARTDLIYTPSTAALPWAAAEAFPPLIDGRAAGPRGHAIYTGWVNVAGLPAIALPFDRSANGLPLGGQFIGGPGQDADVLAFGKSFERSRPALPWPSLAGG